jgi:N-acetyl-alpha-D-glucosaminyl L-malate synthase BshA
VGIACYPTYGGSGVLATELGLALADKGHEVHMFSYDRPTRLGSFHEGLELHTVSVSSYPLFRYPPYDLALSTVMRRVMAERELDILHVHYAVPHALCAYLAREMIPDCKTRIVTTLHGTDLTILGRDPSYGDVIHFGLEHSDAVVCVSQWLADQTREILGFEGKVDVLPNFVDQQVFRPQDDPALREQLCAQGRRIVVHLSNFRPLKRTLDTIEVLRRLPEDLPVLFVLMGDGPDLGLVRDAASRHGLTDKVRFLGEIEKVEPIVAAADVALFPSESESFGLAMLEAQACGVPVVASRVGGLPEVVLHGETGLLEEVGDVDAMAAGLTALLQDEPRRKAMGEAGARRARELFSLERSLDQHVALYRDLLAGAT